MGELRPMPKNGKTKQQKGDEKWENLFLDNGSGRITWKDCDPESLLAAVAAATEDGAAVLLSKTSDGGALHVQVWAGQYRPKFYAANVAELHALLTLIEDTSKTAY